MTDWTVVGRETRDLSLVVQAIQSELSLEGRYYPLHRELAEIVELAPLAVPENINEFWNRLESALATYLVVPNSPWKEEIQRILQDPTIGNIPHLP